MLKHLVCVTRADQAEQGRAADNHDLGLDEYLIKSLRSAAQSGASGFNPNSVGKGPFRDRNGGSRYRPRPERPSKLCRDFRARERKAKPQSCQSEEFAKGPEYDKVSSTYVARQACLGRADIHEGFIDKEEATAGTQRVTQGKQFLFGNDPAIRVVRIGHNRQIRSMQLFHIACV
jgi:hypothetical protein